MAEIFRLPAVSPTMEVGTIVAWRAPEGGRLASGDVLVEVGTDKATVEAQVYDDVVVLARLVPEDAEVPVGAPIAVIGQPGEDVTALVAEARAELAAARPGTVHSAAPPPVASGPAPEPPPAAPPSAPPEPEAPRLGSRWFLDPATPRAAPARVAASPGVDPERVRASPLARRVAFERGVDLTRVTGTGPHGRVLREDVERATVGPAAAPAPAGRPDRVVKLAPMRKVIARRLTESHQQVPVYFLTATYEVDAWPVFRTALAAVRPELRISYNDLLVAAVSRALVLHPRVNASWTDTGIVEHGRVDVGVAVALPDGLVTPVIRGADGLGLAAIAERTRALVAKAREGRLLPEDYQGGTFTVSNLGSFGVEQFTAVINPPEAAILAAGAVRQVPVVTEGRVGTGWRMSVTLSCDHRVIDGAVGAAFLRTLGQIVVAPGLLAV